MVVSPSLWRRRGHKDCVCLGCQHSPVALLGEQPLSSAHPRSLLPPPCWWELGFGDASKLPLPCIAVPGATVPIPMCSSSAGTMSAATQMEYLSLLLELPFNKVFAPWPSGAGEG